MARVPANVFECSVAEFLKNRADAAPDEADALQSQLASKGVTSPKKLANLTLEQLTLPADLPAGHIATIVEGLEQAASWRRALRLNEEGAQARNGLDAFVAPSGRRPIVSLALPRWSCAAWWQGMENWKASLLCWRMRSCHRARQERKPWWQALIRPPFLRQ